MSGYDLNRDFVSGEVPFYNSSDAPINPFIVWKALKYNNIVTLLHDCANGKDKPSYAGIELDIDFDTPFNFYFVHGYKDDELVLFMFTNRSLADTFSEELREPIVWELNEINLQEMRKKRQIPSTLTNQIPID